jgi:hypothetical protein
MTANRHAWGLARGQRRLNMNLFKKALLGTAAGAMALATAAPAEARTHYRHYRHDNTGAIVGAGIIGLAVGALAASRNRGYYDTYYDGYYNQPYYNGYTYYTPGFSTYYYPYNYGYNNGYWYNGYQYNNGWFYDRRGYRSYDRDGWNRHYGHRDGYRHYRR